MNYFNASVELLKSVPDLEQSVKLLEKKKERLIDFGQPSDLHGMDYSNAYVSSGAISNTEKNLIELSQTVKDIQTTKALICEIKGVIAVPFKEQL